MKIKKYNSYNFLGIVEVLYNTWKLIGSCKGKKLNSNKIFHKSFLKKALVSSTYSYVAIDENTKKERGIICIRVSKEMRQLKKSFLSKIIFIRYILNYLVGNLGNNLFTAIKKYNENSVADNFLNSIKSDCYIELIILDKNYKCSGIGSSLLNKALLIAKDKYNCSTVSVWTTSKCDYKFYDKLGFSKIVHLKNYWSNDEDLIIYNKNF